MSTRPLFLPFGGTEADSTAPLMFDQSEPVSDDDLDIELTFSWAPLLYAVGFVGAVVVSVFYPWGLA